MELALGSGSLGGPVGPFAPGRDARAFGQVASAQLMPESALLDARAADVRSIEAHISDLSTLFSRLATVVAEQVGEGRARRACARLCVTVKGERGRRMGTDSSALSSAGGHCAASGVEAGRQVVVALSSVVDGRVAPGALPCVGGDRARQPMLALPLWGEAGRAVHGALLASVGAWAAPDALLSGWGGWVPREQPSAGART